MTVVGIVLLALGGFLVLGNWVCLAEAWRSRKHVSLIPFIGALLAFAGAALVPPIGWKLGLLAFALDPTWSLWATYGTWWLARRGARKLGAFSKPS